MDKKQYRKALETLNMSQLAAGELFGVGPRTSRRWALGQARVPESVSMILNLMVDREMELQIPILDDDGRRVDGKERLWTLSAKVKQVSVEA